MKKSEDNAQNTNLDIYNALKSVPEEYLKKITGGRLKGMSDIKPQWRIMALTEQFGPCGIGWKVQNVTFTHDSKGDEIVCNCSLELVFKHGNKWSDPIPGFGGSMFSTVEAKGVYVSDEAQKMAYTDAISVAAKMIGVAGDVYMGHSGKYGEVPEVNEPHEEPTPIGLAPGLPKVINSVKDVESLNTIWNNNIKLHENVDFLKIITEKRIEFVSTLQELTQIFNSVNLLHTNKEFVSKFTKVKEALKKSNTTQQTA